MGVAAWHAVVLGMTLTALALSACLLVASFRTRRIARGVAAARRRQQHRRLDRRLNRNRPLPMTRYANRRVPIEWIAADLRRLDRQRHGLARESQSWYAAVLRAYDLRLGLASRCLGVSERLEQMQGVDREIERMRVEGQLQAAGLSLRSPLRRRTDRR